MGLSRFFKFPAKADQRVLSGATVLEGNQANTLFQADSAGGAFPITLPPARGVSPGGQIAIVAPVGATNTVTVNVAGGDSYNAGQTAGIALSSANAWLIATSDGDSEWAVLTSSGLLGSVQQQVFGGTNSGSVVILAGATTVLTLDTTVIPSGGYTADGIGAVVTEAGNYVIDFDTEPDGGGGFGPAIRVTTRVLINGAPSGANARTIIDVEPFFTPINGKSREVPLTLAAGDTVRLDVSPVAGPVTIGVNAANLSIQRVS